MFKSLISSYNIALQWFEQLPAFHQFVISSFIMWLTVKIVKFLYDQVLIPRLLITKKIRVANRVIRFAAYEFGLFNKDTRAAFDGLVFLVGRSFTYFIYACLTLSIYWGISSIINGNFLAFLTSVLVVFFLRETKLWLKKPSNKEMENIDPEFKKEALEAYQNINYDSDDDASEQKRERTG